MHDGGRQRVCGTGRRNRGYAALPNGADLCLISRIMTNENHVTENLRVVSLKQLITPTRLKTELPLGDELTEKVLADRQTVRDIILAAAAANTN